MRDFFKGWRRKVGFVLLALACLLCTGWVRSIYENDFILFPFNQRQHAIGSARARLSWSTCTLFRNDKGECSWSSHWFTERQLQEKSDIENSRGVILTQWPIGFEEVSIPYWIPTLPLALLSSVLLLWPQRKARSSDQATNPIINSN